MLATRTIIGIVNFEGQSTVLKSGVYQIVNLRTGKFYIGSSSNCQKRLNNHRSSLRSGNHHNIYLQRSFDKYGESVFVFEQITYSENYISEELELLNERDSRFYNLHSNASGGDTISHHPDNKEIRKKISETSKKLMSQPERVEAFKVRMTGSNNPRYKGVNGHYPKCPLPGYGSGKYDKTGSKNPFYGKTHTAETKAKMKKAREANPHRWTEEEKQQFRKPVCYNGQIYNSRYEVAQILGIHADTVARHCKNPKMPHIYYLDKA